MAEDSSPLNHMLPLEGMWGSFHSVGCDMLVLTQTHQVRFQNNNVHGSSNIWQTQQGKKLIALVFNHAASEQLSKLTPHTLAEKFPGLFFDLKHTVFFVCPRLFATSVPKLLPVPEGTFTVQNSQMRKEDVKFTWIWIHQGKEPEVLLFLENKKVFWEGPDAKRMPHPSGVWSEKMYNSKNYVLVKFHHSGTTENGRARVFKTLEDKIDGLQIWYCLREAKEVKAENLPITEDPFTEILRPTYWSEKICGIPANIYSSQESN